MAITTQKAACNRQPFVSEDGCDRGSVDIYQFDDFPFCDSVSPTPPKVPPEVVDTPIVLPIPSPCACFNINHSFKFKYNKQRKFKAKASFAARGDCCEGEYDAGFDLQIPCPVVGKAVRKIKLKIDYGDSGKSDSEPYIETDKDSCTIEPKDVNLNVNIPCPITGTNKPKIKAKVTYGNSTGQKSAEFLEQDKNNCTIKGKDASLDLQIKCPVIGNAGDKKIKASIKYGSGGASASATYLKTNTETCTVEVRDDVALNLQIPCPVSGDNTKLTIKAKMGNKEKTTSGSILQVNAQACKLSVNPETFTLDLPCPISGTSGDKKIKASIKYGSGGASASAIYLKTNTETCTVEGRDDVALALQIPCPVSKSALNFEASFVQGEQSTGSFKIQKDEFQDCKRTVGFRVTFPRVTAKIAASVVAAIQYANHKLQVKYINLETGVVDATWTDIFTAVAHTGSC